MEEKNNDIIKITADTAEFEKNVDRCIAKVKELIQLGEQADKLLNADMLSKAKKVEIVREPYSSVRYLRVIE